MRWDAVGTARLIQLLARGWAPRHDRAAAMWALSADIDSRVLEMLNLEQQSFGCTHALLQS